MTPRLPPELECYIFYIAFYEDQEMKNTINFILVANRVAEWLYPLIYEVIVIHTARIWPPNRLTPSLLPRFGRHVRHLLLRITPAIADEDVLSYFTHCSNIRNLAVWIPHSDPREDLPIMEYLTKLPYLTELSIDLDTIPESPDELLSQVLSRITHLDIVTDLSDGEDCESITQFPSLTHLSVFSDIDSQFVPMIFEVIPNLKVLVLWEGNEEVSISEGFADNLPEDPRVVLLLCDFVRGWERSARGLASTWEFAERIIERRRVERQAEEEEDEDEESSVFSDSEGDMEMIIEGGIYSPSGI